MISGIVIRGKGFGRIIGYPTANFYASNGNIELRDGVYAAYANIFGRAHPAAIIVWSEENRVEAHIIGYEGDDFYGETISIDPVQKVSEIEEKNNDDLIKKIIADIESVKAALKI